MKKGKFISIEGIEGVGKSCNAKIIEKCLKQAEIKVTMTREPGGTPVAEKIRTILKDSNTEKITEMSELLMMFSSRSQNVRNVIAPSLTSGNWVICDRFTDSTRAYQGGGRGIPIDTINKLASMVHKDINPDFIFLFDAPIDVCINRIRKRGKLDRFESENFEFFNKVRNAYLGLAASKPDKFILIDTNKSFSEVKNDVEKEIKKIIKSSIL